MAGANRHLAGTVKTLKRDPVFVHSKLTGAGAAALTVNEPFQFGSAVESVTRVGVGEHDIVFSEKWPQTIAVIEPTIVTATADTRAYWSALDLAAGTGTLVIETAGVAAELTTADDVYIAFFVRNVGTSQD